MLSSSDDKTLKIWNDRKFKSSLIGHNNWVNSGKFSKDLRYVGSGSDD